MLSLHSLFILDPPRQKLHVLVGKMLFELLYNRRCFNLKWVPSLPVQSEKVPILAQQLLVFGKNLAGPYSNETLCI